MALSKLHILLLFSLFALISTQIRADDAGDGTAFGSDESGGYRIELDKLTSKIQSLESLVYKKNGELRTKDEIIAWKEKTIAEKERMIKEKSEYMMYLQNEVASFKVNGPFETDEEVLQVHTRAEELEKQVEELQLELEQNASLREALEARTKELEENMLELNPKLHDLEDTIEEQKTKLQRTERALKFAEEELMKTKNEATQKIEELTKVYSAWLPLWLAARLSSSQSYVEARWKEHGKPAFDTFTKKALEKKAQAEMWAAPHLDIVKSVRTFLNFLKWVIVITTVEPHVQLLTKKTKEVYVQSKEVLTSHVTKIKEAVDPHFQVAKKFCKPYVDQVAVATKPHLDKARETMKPYTNEVVQVYAKFLESASKYHHQVRGTVEESLKKHGITRFLATKEFVWFSASALLALPIMILFRAFSALFFGTPKKPAKTSKPSHTRRKAKRAH
ncbi:hypothetical protein QVD17_26945 [Tagetes erecta]|uniref:Uncharacterized protein n=1 Tax=Tagetes erecta TaxID=13708 RepID=A0AAD8NR95_TARER|nr:hypothetical protein QVD17_26945 [Tagetes erecta]